MRTIAECAGDFLEPSYEASLRAGMERWAALAMKRNVLSLRRGRGPGGRALAPLKDYTIRRKGHAVAGIDKGVMVRQLENPTNVERREPTLYVVYATPATGRDVVKMNAFLKGQKSRVRTYTVTSGGRTRTRVKRIPRVRARDFIGLDPRDIDEACGVVLTGMFREAGFR